MLMLSFLHICLAYLCPTHSANVDRRPAVKLELDHDIHLALTFEHASLAMCTPGQIAWKE